MENDRKTAYHLLLAFAVRAVLLLGLVLIILLLVKGIAIAWSL
jgi:hypothetical protein